MNFKVKRPDYNYSELIITADNVKLESGLLDRNESREIALSMISAAADLLQRGHEEHYNKLVDIVNELS
jgi:hypothetical protein